MKKKTENILANPSKVTRLRMSGENEARSVMRKMTQCKEKSGVQNERFGNFTYNNTQTHLLLNYTHVSQSHIWKRKPSTKTYYRKKRKMFSHSIEANNEWSE